MSICFYSVVCFAVCVGGGGLRGAERGFEFMLKLVRKKLQADIKNSFSITSE